MKLVKTLAGDARYRAVISLIVNLLYAFYNSTLGIAMHSAWFAVSGIYYIILSTVRFVAVTYGRRESRKIMSFTGMMLAALSLVMGAILYISLTQNTASVRGTVPMITIATFTFTKLGLAIRSAVKNKNNPSPTLASIRAIRYSEIAVSVVTMQQSMIVSFGDMAAVDKLILNLFTGIAACVFIMAVGILTFNKSKNRTENNNE